MTANMVKVNSKSQNGRSMVEMLGVLSIIGVLSVGGINAYSTAMEKYKTNELMAATMQEAVLISAQLAMGSTRPSLTRTGSYFSSVALVDGTDNFKLTLSGVEEDVCKNVKSMLGSTSMVQSINDNCTEMIIHKNLTPKSATQSGGSASGNGGTENGGNGGGSTEPADPCSDIDCGDHGTCVDGTCECDAGYTGDLCDEEEIISCSANSDCPNTDTFCLMDSETSGTCQPVGTVTTVGSLLVNTTPMNYWSSQNWCESNNARLVKGCGSNSLGPFCSDNIVSVNIFSELFGIKKAYAITEPCFSLNQELISVISSSWATDKCRQNIPFIITSNNGGYAPSLDTLAPVVCVPK